MELQATYWTLQDLGDPLLLLHHVKVLPQVWRHVPAAEVLRVTLVHSVEVALLGVIAGQGQGQGPRCLPHLHQTHVLAAVASSLFLWNLQESMKHHSLALLHNQAVKATGFVLTEKILYVCSGDSFNYRDGDKREENIVV